MDGYRRTFRFYVPQWAGEPKSEYWARLRQWRYEEAVVKHIVDRLHMPQLRRELWKEHKRKNDDDFGRLTLEDFRVYTGFPLWLRSKRIDTRRPPSIRKLFRELLRTPLGAAFAEVWNTAPPDAAGLPTGVVFPAPGAKFMVLHTFPSEPQLGKTRMVIPLQRPKGATLILESIDDLLAALPSVESW